VSFGDSVRGEGITLALGRMGLVEGASRIVPYRWCTGSAHNCKAKSACAHDAVEMFADS
jgi:hypothetical protein